MNRFLALGLLIGSVLSQISYAAEAPKKPVKIDKVTEMVLPATSVFMGTVESRTHIPITAGVNGRIEKIAQPGDFVQLGDTLIEMDTLPLQLRLAEQKAQEELVRKAKELAAAKRAAEAAAKKAKEEARKRAEDAKRAAEKQAAAAKAAAKKKADAAAAAAKKASKKAKKKLKKMFK